MHSCIEQFLSKIRPKIPNILRTRGYYSVPDLIIQLIEVNIGGYFHVCSILLAKIDHAQNCVLSELDLTPGEACLEFNLAPAKFRQNITVLDLLHKRMLGKCHSVYERLLPWFTHSFPQRRDFGNNKQLYNHSCEISARLGLFNRSIFPMIDLHNKLTQHVIDVKNIASFQEYLTHIARTRFFLLEN